MKKRWKGGHGEQNSLLLPMPGQNKPDKSPKMTHESKNYRSNHDLRPGRGAFASQLAGQTRTKVK